MGTDTMRRSNSYAKEASGIALFRNSFLAKAAPSGLFSYMRQCSIPQFRN